MADLTGDLLLSLGFKKHEPTFENIKLPYYVKNKVCLFYNEVPSDVYLIGYGFSYQADFNGENKYYAATFKWIDTLAKLNKYYECFTGEKLIEYY